jgi:hypothetical protein
MKIRCITASLSLALVLASAPCSADSATDASFKKGVEYYREADYRSSLAEFRKAYTASGRDYRVLYNIAQCEYQLTNYVGALDSFESFLGDGGAAVSADRRTEINQELVRLKARVASLDIKSSLEVEISVDGDPFVKLAKDKPVRVNPGRHKVEARADGFEPRLESVEVVGGDTKSVDVTPNRKVQARALAVPGAPPPAEVTTPNWVTPGVLWAGTGGLAAGATVFGVLALNNSSKLQTERDALNANATSLADRSSTTRTFAVVSDVLVGCAAVAGVFAVYFTVRAVSQGGGGPTAAVGIAPDGIRVRGTFQ